MSCLFCGIVNKEIPARIIAENSSAIAFLDINPMADGHTVVISRQHYANLSDSPEKVLSDMIILCKKVATMIDDSKLRPWGFNYLSNQGKIAGQEIMHIHFHVIPKYGKEEGFKFGMAKNKYINPDLENVFKIITK